MIVTCPRCHRSLSTADDGDAPSFCMYCGHKLRDSNAPSAGATNTMSFSPTGSGEDDAEVPIAPEPAPKTIGGYRLLRLLGAGGMGAVYEAEAPGSAARVAVKLLSSKLASNPISVERFKQEGRLASQLTHPRCVFVLSADADAGRPYIVMELMPGETLRDIVDSRGPLGFEQAITHILDVIDGLAEAHRIGVIHRDMKPSNCFLTADGRVKVGDFGLSKSLITSRNQHLTQSGAFLGTVLFASPEQIRGETLDYASDVYSVCATLYYLLCGEAPYHHESITAVLAKAVSEDAPPISQKRADVPRGLEAIVMKGLQRERPNRWQSLDDLRDALVALLPSRQHPARPRALVGAYVLDRIFLLFLAVPAELIRIGVTGTGGVTVDLFELRWLSGLILIAYFTVGEGLFGATPGKWLLGMRVSRPGQTGPPGLWRAGVRAFVFHTLLMGVFIYPEKMVEWFGPSAGGLLGGFIFIAAAAALLAQVRKRWGFRGLHDVASGCHVTQKPLPARKLRLIVKYPTPLATVLPAPADALPESLGGYSVLGRVSVDPCGEQVWAGEDRALARVVLIWLKPVASGTIPLHEAARPTRLRRLGGGSVVWGGTEFEWSAFAGPLGGPLADAITPNRRLPWADARHLLDQLVEEFRAAEIDGTLPARIGLDQVWVEPTGRVQFLECSLCGGITPPAASPLMLLREVAVLALEGRPRAYAGAVLAPLPSHAIPVMNRLFTDGGYPTLVDFQKDLAETHAHRPEVTPAVRAAQLGIQGAVLVIPLAALFILAFVLAPWLVLAAKNRADQGDAALAALHDPQQKEKLTHNPGLVEPLKHPKLEPRLEDFRKRKRDEQEFRRSMLLAPQRMLLEQVEEHAPDDEERLHGFPVQVREAIHWAGAIDGTPRAKQSGPWKPDALPIMVIMAIIPLGMVTIAGVTRGGVSMLVAGVSLVNADGQPATRRQCAWRAALVWLPLTGLLFATAWLQASAPERAYLAAALWLIAIALVPVYIVLALRFPDRPPQDRLTGTYLVPA